VTVTADAKRRVRLGSVRPGDRFDVQLTDGKVVLTRLEPVKANVQYIRKNGLLLAKSNRPITWEETRQAIEDWQYWVARGYEL